MVSLPALICSVQGSPDPIRSIFIILETQGEWKMEEGTRWGRAGSAENTIPPLRIMQSWKTPWKSRGQPRHDGCSLITITITTVINLQFTE